MFIIATFSPPQLSSLWAWCAFLGGLYLAASLASPHLYSANTAYGKSCGPFGAGRENIFLQLKAEIGVLRRPTPTAKTGQVAYTPSGNVEVHGGG